MHFNFIYTFRSSVHNNSLICGDCFRICLADLAVKRSLSWYGHFGPYANTMGITWLTMGHVDTWWCHRKQMTAGPFFTIDPKL